MALAAATVVMTRAIRANPEPAVPEPGRADPLAGRPVAMFLFAVALLGLGFQVHFALNAAPGFLRFAKPEDLPYLMPVFWIGFNLLILPASLATKRYGGPAMMAIGAAVGRARRGRRRERRLARRAGRRRSSSPARRGAA